MTRRKKTKKMRGMKKRKTEIEGTEKGRLRKKDRKE